MTMPTAHARGTPDSNAAPELVDTTGGASAVAANLLTTGTYQAVSGRSCTIYPDGYPTVWPAPHHHHHYPWYPTTTTELRTQLSGASAEKPHEVVQRALKEIAQATRALRESAEVMGVPVEAAALEEAIVARLRAAL